LARQELANGALFDRNVRAEAGEIRDLLVFTQVGIPAKNAKSINAGWKSHYWDLLKKAFPKD
jgi:hypothetical protein